MKTKIHKILGVALTVSLLASLALVASPVSGATSLKWNAETGMPSTLTTSNQLVSGSDVNGLAVAADGSVIWAVDATSNRTYKSTDGGTKWLRKTSGVAGTVALVAIAPDDANIVAIVGSNGTNAFVRVSTNGGTSFSSLTGHTLTNVTDVAISPITSGAHYVTIAGNVSGAATIAYFNLGAAVPKWTVASDWTGMDADTSVTAIAYSPAFASDKILVAITENTSTGVTLYEVASFASKKWNDDAGFADYDGTKNQIAIAPPLTKASISLYPTYLGADESERKAFIGLDNGTTGGLYRMTDDAEKAIKSATRITSVDYDGTNLVAGAAANNIVYRSSNPLAASPTVSSTSLYQRPGGATAVSVAWNGEQVVAGTVGNESAFAVSSDNGKTFNDVSLIDTVLTNIEDITLTDDGSTFLMLTDDGADLSLWRKASAWQRILSLKGNATADIVRIAPNDAGTIYLGDTSSTSLYYSDDGGETKWQLRALNAAPADIAVESADVAYALQANGKVSKTTNAGFIWGTAKSTTLAGGATIKSLGEGLLVAGGTGGGIAWSSNGNSTWTKKTGITGGGSMQVAASGVADGDYIYAGGSTAGGNIVRWKIGTSTSASDIITGTVTGGVSGLVYSGGTVYAVTNNVTDNISRLYRNISPTTATSASAWDVVTTAVAVNLGKGSQGAKLTTGSQKIWAVNDTTTDKVYTFIDDAYSSGIALSSPADAAVTNVNPVTGRSADVVFSWSRLSKTTAYSLVIAYDSAFKENVTTIAKASTGSTVVQAVGPYQPAGTTKVELQPGTTYYWRIKATTPVASPWSETRSFTVESIDEPFSIGGPAAGASEVSVTPLMTWDEYPGAIGYQLALSEDPSFAIVEWVRNVDNNFYSIDADDALKNSTTYYWRVRGVTGEAYKVGRATVVPTGPWVTGVFSTAAAAADASEPTVITITEPAPPAEVTVIEIPVTDTKIVQQAIPDYLLWTIIVIGGVLVIALIVLIVRTRRVA